jgi:hypothetical protein
MFRFRLALTILYIVQSMVQPSSIKVAHFKYHTQFEGHVDLTIS